MTAARDLRYVVAELRTRGEVGLADILEQAVSNISVGVEPAGTRGAATSPDNPGHVAPSGLSPGGCAAPDHSPIGPDRRARGARFVPGASASSASDKTPNIGSFGSSSAARKRRPSITVQLSDRVVELEAMLRRILDAEWMVMCDWTQPSKRDALLSDARRVLDNRETT